MVLTSSRKPSESARLSDTSLWSDEDEDGDGSSLEQRNLIRGPPLSNERCSMEAILLLALLQPFSRWLPLRWQAMFPFGNVSCLAWMGDLILKTFFFLRWRRHERARETATRARARDGVRSERG